MSKYIIEIAEEYEEYFKGVLICGIADGKFAVDVIAREDLEELNSDYINEHYGELQDDAYNKGYAQCQDDYSDALKHAKDTAYKKGLHDGESKCGYCNEYQRGLEDAWESARKLFSSMADSDIEKAFPTEWNNGGFKALMNLQPQEAIAKLKAYEDKHPDCIEVGDVVERYVDGKLDSKGIYLEEDDGYWRCLFYTGAILMTFAYPKEQFKKTGEHYDIQSILEAMRT